VPDAVDLVAVEGVAQVPVLLALPVHVADRQPRSGRGGPRGLPGAGGRERRVDRVRPVARVRAAPPQRSEALEVVTDAGLTGSA
jgi:hypothetical protein